MTLTVLAMVMIVFAWVVNVPVNVMAPLSALLAIPLVALVLMFPAALSFVVSAWTLETPFWTIANPILCRRCSVALACRREVFVFMGLSMIGWFSWPVARFVSSTEGTAWSPSALTPRPSLVYSEATLLILVVLLVTTGDVL